MAQRRGGSVKKRMRHFKNTSILICYYCGKPLTLEEATVDHKTPRSRGGSDTERNFCIACHDCNNEKADMTEEEYMIYKKTYGKARLDRDIDISRRLALHKQELAMRKARKDSRVLDINKILGKRRFNK